MPHFFTVSYCFSLGKHKSRNVFFTVFINYMFCKAFVVKFGREITPETKAFFTMYPIFLGWWRYIEQFYNCFYLNQVNYLLKLTNI